LTPATITIKLSTMTF